MPNIIKINDISDDMLVLNSIPIGIYKDSLNVCRMNILKRQFNMISANDITDTLNFGVNLLNLFNKNCNFNRVIIDAENYFEGTKLNYAYYNNNFDNVISELKKINTNNVQKYNSVNNNRRLMKDVPSTVCIIIGFDKFLNKLSEDSKKEFYNILSDNKDLLKINFVAFDVPSGFKKYEYDEWFKNNVDSYCGLWVGPGINQQFAIKVNVSLSEFNNIGKDYALIVINGKAVALKVLNEFKINVN